MCTALVRHLFGIFLGSVAGQASTWVPISTLDSIIFVPQPGLTSATVDATVYGSSAAISLNGLGD